MHHGAAPREGERRVPVSTDPARRGTPFRLAGDQGNAAARSTDLEELLRTRLRVATALAAITASGLGGATLLSNWPRIRADAVAAFTIPPFAGPMLLMAAGMALMWLLLAPGRRPTLRLLRAAEWTMIGAWATFFVIIITGDLSLLLAELAKVPIDLAMAHSSMWGLMLVACGVLLPSTPRAGAIRNGMLVLCTFVPDLIVFGGLEIGPPNVAVYIGTKTVMAFFYAAIATYGGYRIETLRRDAQAARQLGQYVLTSPLGAGGMGEVYRAEHRLLRRPCAVKLIRPDQAGDEATLQRFEREARATAGLTHPSTVQVYDYGIAEDGTFYYVMELLPGVTLEELLRTEGVQSPARVVHIVSQLCGALQEAHDLGLVHRDIKPGNVMLSDRGGVRDVAKLLDFGLVGAVRQDNALASTEAGGEVTLVGALVGTPAYMSPEQCGDGEIGPASDLYSLGALTFTLLTGRAPFAGRDQMQLLWAHLQETPPRVDEVNPTVPASIADVVARCLAKHPGERPASALALSDALDRALA
ncbi:MAG: serine/threonine-protein kinase [Gemmatimonadales bacterium]|nr:serine/threonine-protein kinase [Gemmatimonadales bacterium]